MSGGGIKSLLKVTAVLLTISCVTACESKPIDWCLSADPLIFSDRAIDNMNRHDLAQVSAFNTYYEEHCP